MAKQLWSCPGCGLEIESEAVAGDDWDDGELVGVGPTCEACKIEMEPIIDQPAGEGG